MTPTLRPEAIRAIRSRQPRLSRLWAETIHPLGFHVISEMVVSDPETGFAEGLACCLICGQEVPELRPDATTMRSLMAGPDIMAPVVANPDCFRFRLLISAIRLVRRVAPHSRLLHLLSVAAAPYARGWLAAHSTPTRRGRRSGSARAKRLIPRPTR